MVHAEALELLIHLECIRILINKTSAVLHKEQSGQFGR